MNLLVKEVCPEMIDMETDFTQKENFYQLSGKQIFTLILYKLDVLRQIDYEW